MTSVLNFEVFSFHSPVEMDESALADLFNGEGSAESSLCVNGHAHGVQLMPKVLGSIIVETYNRFFIRETLAMTLNCTLLSSMSVLS